MAVSRDSEYRTTTTWTRLVGRLTRYDLVLTAIPALFLTALLAHVAFTVPFHLAVATGASLSVLFLVDALYVNPPVEDGEN